MVKRWVEWFLLCFFATLHYHVFVLILTKDIPVTYRMALIFLAIYMLFVSAFYWVDNWFIHRNFTHLRKGFVLAIILRIVMAIPLFILALVGNQDPFYMLFPDVYVVDKTINYFMGKYLSLIQIMPKNHDEYKQYEILVGATIFLVAEFCFCFGGAIVLGGFTSSSDSDEISEKELVKPEI